jgi:phospholipid-binding lipoprotein MlaA
MRHDLSAGLALAGLLSLWATAAPAQSAPAAAESPVAAQGVAPAYDPWEPMNRGLFRFNKGLDHAVIRPLAIGYKTVLPSPVRTGVRNVINNIGEPLTFVNDVLELRFTNAGHTVTRFTLNSTVGVLGLFDVAGKVGVPIHYADFGETLGRYGVPQGPYLYLPVLGPSSVRDGAGRIVDVYTGLLNLHDLHVTPGERLGVTAVDGLDTRAELDDQLSELQRSATDEYATQRSLYLQNRQSLVTNQAAAVQRLPDFDAPTSAPARETDPPKAAQPKGEKE